MHKHLIKYLEDHNFPSGRRIKGKEHKTFFDEVKEITKFLDDTFSAPQNDVRLACIINEITEVPLCRVCGEKHVKQRKYKKDGEIYPLFTETCSRECASQDPTRIENSRKGQLNLSEEDKIKKVEKTRQTIKEKTNGEFEWGSQIPKVKDKAKITWSMKSEEEKKLKVEKAKQTYFEKTGYYNPSQNPEVIEYRGDIFGSSNFGRTEKAKEKRDNINKTKYGDENYFRTSDFKEKVKKSNNEKCGVDWNTQRDDVKQKAMKTKKIKTGREYNHQAHIPQESIRTLGDAVLLQELVDTCNGSFTEMANMLGVHRKTVARNIKKHGIVVDKEPNVSSFEIEVRNMIQELYEGEVVFNAPLLDGKHIDIFLPELNIGFECNGSYFHSSAKKEKNYHYDKTNIAIEKGIRLIHVWEHLWKNKQSLIRRLVKNLLGVSSEKIYARNCVTQRIDPKSAREFLELNHLQGFVSSSFHIGIFNKDELVGVLSLKENRKESNEFELTRFCTSVNVVGGFSKSLSYFKKSVPTWKEITTFADRDISYGGLYEVCGFEKTHITEPIMSYYDPNSGECHHRKKFMKSRLSGKVDIFDDLLTEKEIMELNGYLRLYNSGLIKFIMTNPNT